MFTLSQEVQTVLIAFAPLFSNPVWLNVQILAVGTILCTGKRTVTSVLMVMGLKEDEHFTNFHRVLNRAKWSALRGSEILFGLLIILIPHGWPLIIAVDETVERRKGKKIKAKGCYRDAVRSTEKKVVTCFGLKWISMMLIVPLPWSSRPWALPFLTVLAPSKAHDESAGRRHKTTVDWTRQMIMQVSRRAAHRSVVLIGDGAYAAVRLALCCAGLPGTVSLVSRLRTDARLYDFPPPETPGRRGPKPKKGKKQPSLSVRIKDPETQWTPIEVVWYEGVKRTLEIFSGISLWYKAGLPPVPIKWVAVRDPEGKLRTEAFFSTDSDATEKQILEHFVMRWNIEVTFEELRRHLGFETQRQWSESAIQRTTPALFAMFSVIILIALELLKSETLPVLCCAWYKKSEATFSDVIAFVRRHIWSLRNYTNSDRNDNCTDLKPDILNVIIDTICYGL